MGLGKYFPSNELTFLGLAVVDVKYFNIDIETQKNGRGRIELAALLYAQQQTCRDMAV